MKALFLETSRTEICLEGIKSESCGPITFLLLVLVGKIFVDPGGHRYKVTRTTRTCKNEIALKFL